MSRLEQISAAINNAIIEMQELDEERTRLQEENDKIFAALGEVYRDGCCRGTIKRIVTMSGRNCTEFLKGCDDE